MIQIKQYVKVSSLDEAYELNQKKSNVIIGGMQWLKMKQKTLVHLWQIREQSSVVSVIQVS